MDYRVRDSGCYRGNSEVVMHLTTVEDVAGISELCYVPTPV